MTVRSEDESGIEPAVTIYLVTVLYFKRIAAIAHDDLMPESFFMIIEYLLVRHSPFTEECRQLLLIGHRDQCSDAASAWKTA